jgi:adenylate cyclase
VAIEIERKFLVIDDRWRAEACRPQPMMQAYLGGDHCSVRVRIAGERAWLTLKSARVLDMSQTPAADADASIPPRALRPVQPSDGGVARLEFEYAVPPDEARQMIEAFASGPTLTKTRYHVVAGELTWEIDVFEGENAGLVLAEIELPQVDTPVPQPPWLGAEVSSDTRYLNLNLARHPWRRWSEAERAPC